MTHGENCKVASQTTGLIRTLDLKTYALEDKKYRYPVDLAILGFSNEVWIIDCCLNLPGFRRANSCGLHSFALFCSRAPLLLASSTSAGDFWVSASNTHFPLHCWGCPMPSPSIRETLSLVFCSLQKAKLGSWG